MCVCVCVCVCVFLPFFLGFFEVYCIADALGYVIEKILVFQETEAESGAVSRATLAAEFYCKQKYTIALLSSNLHMLLVYF